MINNEILSYIRGELVKGTLHATIKNNLKTGGWTDDDITEAFVSIKPVSQQTIQSANVTPEQIQQPQPVTAKPQITTPLVEEIALQTISEPQTIAPLEVEETKPQPISFWKQKTPYIILGIIILLILTLSGSVYAYFRITTITPNEIAADMINQMSHVTSVAFSAPTSIVASIISPQPQTVHTTISIDGAFDTTDTKDRKAMFETKITSDLSSLIPLQNIGAEFRAFKDSIYLKISLPNQSLETMAPFLLPFNNQWISIEKGQTGSGTNEIPSVVDKYKDALSKPYESIVDKPWTEEQKNALKKLLFNQQTIILTDVKDGTQVDNKPMYHFNVAIKQDKLLGLLTQITDIDKYVHITQQQLDEFRKAYQDQKYSLDESSVVGEVWIGKQDHLLYQATLNLTGKNSTGSSTLTTTLNLSQFNQKQDILKPTDKTIPFETFIQTLFGGFLSSMNSNVLPSSSVNNPSPQDVLNQNQISDSVPNH